MMRFETVLRRGIYTAIFAAIFALFYFMFFSPSARQLAAAAEVAAARQEAADEKPHVIREADGCKVYAFKVGDTFHMFTRCGNETVTTDRQYTTQHREGKQTITEKHTEQIITNGPSGPL